MFPNPFFKPASMRFYILAIFGLSLSLTACAQAAAASTDATPELKRQPEREIIWEGLASYGQYKIFATENGTKIYTSGVEYDRHSWGYTLGARMDYVAEFLPFVLFSQSAVTDLWGNQLSPNRRYLSGIGLSPIGLRMMWLDKRTIKPYVLVKGGVLVFNHKPISDHTTYENFSMESGFGVQVKTTRRVDLRFGLWGDFHFSDGFIVPINPGTDMMNANFGVSYHLAPPTDRPGHRRWFPRL